MQGGSRVLWSALGVLKIIIINQSCEAPRKANEAFENNLQTTLRCHLSVMLVIDKRLVIVVE